MNFDDLLRRYFASSTLSDITPDVRVAGIERMLVDFGLEQDRARRFALWALLHSLGAAPALDVAFDNAQEREIARNLMDLLDAAEPDDR